MNAILDPRYPNELKYSAKTVHARKYLLPLLLLVVAAWSKSIKGKKLLGVDCEKIQQERNFLDMLEYPSSYLSTLFLLCTLLKLFVVMFQAICDFHAARRNSRSADKRQFTTFIDQLNSTTYHIHVVKIIMKLTNNFCSPKIINWGSYYRRKLLANN